jgi:hypothetical protein
VSGARLLLLGVVAAAVVALGMSSDGSPPAGPGGLESSPVPTAGLPGALSSTWFCAAGGAGTEQPPVHRLYLFNPSGDTASARLIPSGPEGPLEEQVVEVVSPGPTVVDVAELFGAPNLSVMVESDAGELVVEHRLSASVGADQVACATSSSDTWYFPAQTSVLGTSAQLHLFNPFPSDASVDIAVSLEDGVRLPAQWQGFVVPAGSTAVIDLGSQEVGGANRREQFAVSVEARRGRVVAETAQVLDTEASDDGSIPATRGLRLQLGVPRPADTWAFATGFTGRGANERLVLFNPGDEAASALVQVTPYGGAELAPEPFELEVPPRRYTTLDLSAETRVPGQGLHAITVQTEGVGVVAGRVVTITGGRAPSPEGIARRPPLDRGTAVGTGSPVSSPLWAATGVVVGEDQDSSVLVHNPSTGIVVVSATAFGEQGDGTVLADAVEVPAGDSLAIPTAGQGLGSGAVTVVVEAQAPVVVERTLTFAGRDDLSMGLAVPLRPDGDALADLGG